MTSTQFERSFIHTCSILMLCFALTSGAGILEAQTSGHLMHGTTSPTRVADVIRDPTDRPSPIARRMAAIVGVTLTAEEVLGELDASSGTTYRYWTFNGKVPGPMIRVRQGDTIEVTLRNDSNSHMAHSLDFHAALGPGGGAALSQVVPGQSKTFTFQATTPGLFVYHCGTPMIAEHIANGMYGLILVEPNDGLPAVDQEYYVMQGEIYTTAAKGKAGLQQFSGVKLMAEDPEYFVFNGAVDALTSAHPMRATVGETVRIFFGDAGPNANSSLHVVGEIFTQDYELGSLLSPALAGVQTANVPPGAAAILEFKASVPGEFTMMDHAMARMAKGLMAHFDISGPENAALMHAGPVPDSFSPESARVSGLSRVDEDVSRGASGATVPVISRTSPTGGEAERKNSIPAMHMEGMSLGSTPRRRSDTAATSTRAAATLNGCLTLASDGKVMLRVLPSAKVYRLEARPLLFSENADRLVHVTGYFGSVVEVEDPRVPSFVVDTLDSLAPNCSVRLSASAIRKALAKPATLARGTVGMSETGFVPPTITVNAGDRVVWKNSSQTIHNVVDDAGKALVAIDVKLPTGGSPFDSGLLEPGQSFSRVFTVPGVYRYVCTLHERMGMKGVVIVRSSSLLAAQK